MKIIASKIMLLAVLFSTALLVSCKKEKEKAPAPNEPYSCATCADSPEALASNDASSAGIYKGVITGSSGNFKIVLENGSSNIFIVATFQGVTDTLTTNSLSSWNPGDAIVSAVFTGDQEISITFSVNADGSSPTATAAITGYSNVTVSIVKETSTTLVQCFEGTFAGFSSGNFNFWLTSTSIGGVAKSTTGSPDIFTGNVTGTTITGITSNSTNFSGTLSGDNASGNWNNSYGSGTWTGKRTL
ncbi:MAG: hypothetical protein K2X86_19205 [Cytophagaceae bacterium]|nr:hypothetical protein [Cytophagaceae bacterium]